MTIYSFFSLKLSCIFSYNQFYEFYLGFVVFHIDILSNSNQKLKYLKLGSFLHILFLISLISFMTSIQDMSFSTLTC